MRDGGQVTGDTPGVADDMSGPTNVVIAFAGYLQGLRDSGWQGDATLARLGYTLAFTLRNGFGIFNIEWAGQDEKLGRWIEDVIGHSLEELADTFRVLRTYIVDCAAEARGLLASPAVRRLL